METIAKGVDALKYHEWRAKRLKRIAKKNGIAHLAPEITVFSDTVVISCPPEPFAVETLISQVQGFCTKVMLAGVYARGAIVQGPLYHRAGVIIGPALVEAHDLERTVAKYPRIVLADSLVPGAEFYSLQPDTAQVPAASLLRDQDSLPILNLFSGPHGPFPKVFVNHLRSRVDRDFALHFGNLDIRAKLGWLLTHLQQTLDGMGDEHEGPGSSLSQLAAYVTEEAK